MKEKSSMINVPYIAYEKEMEHKNAVIKIMGASVICLIVTIVLVVYMFMSFINAHDFRNYAQDGNGVNNINEGTQGDLINESSVTKND